MEGPAGLISTMCDTQLQTAAHIQEGQNAQLVATLQCQGGGESKAEKGTRPPQEAPETLSRYTERVTSAWLDEPDVNELSQACGWTLLCRIPCTIRVTA